MPNIQLVVLNVSFPTPPMNLEKCTLQSDRLFKAHHLKLMVVVGHYKHSHFLLLALFKSPAYNYPFVLGNATLENIINKHIIDLEKCTKEFFF
jgi:hypothetical protein